MTAYDSISDPVLVVLISNSSIIYANKAANKLFQFSSLKGQSLDGLIPDLSMLLKKSGQELLKERMDGRRRDGSAFALLVSVSHLAKEGVYSKKGHQDVVVLTLNMIPTKSLNTVSRYKKEFEEVKVVGRGGFGIVLEAKNRLDGQYYAIKKGKVKPMNIHGIVVSYFSAPKLFS